MSRAFAALLLATASCAWSNPVNRPVWNAFERNLVPDRDAAFYATLPLTVPAGLGAILTDTLVVHPVRVIDDAAGDAADHWRDFDWQKHYYTELGFLPLRVAWTPVVFIGSWLGRACFDIPPRQNQDPAARAAAKEREAVALRADWLAFFGALAQQQPATRPPAKPPAAWDTDLAAAFDRALGAATARGRHDLLRAAARQKLPPLAEAPWLGLRDRDPVVRYLELLVLSRKDLPADLRHALLTDENEMVRLLATERLRD